MVGVTQELISDPPASGLRSLKKERTRLAIQDAALDLFAEQGFEATTVEQIAARAQVGPATFWRYFKTKSEVIFSVEGYSLVELEKAIVGRPKSEDDLMAVRRAFQDRWLPLLDTERIVRQFRAASASPVLRGLSTELGMQWQTVISRALAKRRKLRIPDQRARLTAAITLAVFSSVVNGWMEGGCSGELRAALDRGFVLLADLQRLAD